jgi:predicted transcriptional regulator
MPKTKKMTAMTIRLDDEATAALEWLATPEGGYSHAPASAIIRALIVERVKASGAVRGPAKGGRK